MENIQEIFSIVQQPVYMFCWGGGGREIRTHIMRLGQLLPMPILGEYKILGKVIIKVDFITRKVEYKISPKTISYNDSKTQ